MNQESRDALVANFKHNAARQEQGLDEDDLMPPVKLFIPFGAWMWLLTELNPDDNVAFGLCDLGMGFPELGYVSLDELLEVRTSLSIPIVQDTGFRPTMTLCQYADRARAVGEIRA